MREIEHSRLNIRSRRSKWCNGGSAKSGVVIDAATAGSETRWLTTKSIDERMDTTMADRQSMTNPRAGAQHRCWRSTATFPRRRRRWSPRSSRRGDQHGDCGSGRRGVRKALDLATSIGRGLRGPEAGRSSCSARLPSFEPILRVDRRRMRGFRQISGEARVGRSHECARPECAAARERAGHWGGGRLDESVGNGKSSDDVCVFGRHIAIACAARVCRKGAGVRCLARTA